MPDTIYYDKDGVTEITKEQYEKIQGITPGEEVEGNVDQESTNRNKSRSK